MEVWNTRQPRGVWLTSTVAEWWGQTPKLIFRFIYTLKWKSTSSFALKGLQCDGTCVSVICDPFLPRTGLFLPQCWQTIKHITSTILQTLTLFVQQMAVYATNPTHCGAASPQEQHKAAFTNLLNIATELKQHICSGNHFLCSPLKENQKPKGRNVYLLVP